MVLVHAKRSGRRGARGAESLSRGSVQVWGESIYYEASGSPEEGPTILFLHESGGAGATWQEQLIGLAEKARCIVPDLPGHGKSEGCGFSTVGDYRRAVLGFLDALAIRWPVFVAGVCLGATVAVDLAVHAPERVNGLILAGASESGRLQEPVRISAVLGESSEGFVESLFGSGAGRKLVSDRVRRWYRTSPPVRYGDLSAVASYRLREGLSRVTHPTLLVAGEEDPIAGPINAWGLAESVSAVRVAEIPRAGCLSMAEQPARFNRELADFLTGLHAAYPIDPTAWQPGGYRRF